MSSAAASAEASAPAWATRRSCCNKPPSMAMAATPTMPVRHKAVSAATLPLRFLTFLYMTASLVRHRHDRSAGQGNATQVCFGDPVVGQGYGHRILNRKNVAGAVDPNVERLVARVVSNRTVQATEVQ